MEKNNYIYEKIGILFPNAQCELIYHNLFELLIAVVLSAQTTDKKVNVVSRSLFEKYPDAASLSKAEIDDVINIIKPLGLSKVKSKNIIALSNKLINDTNGIIPNDFSYLVTLPGVGRKTANVILSEGFKMPAIAVDTHVLRVSNRLGLSSSNDPNIVEQDLMKLFAPEIWGELHLRLLFFGRYYCKSQNPECLDCPFKEFCKK